MARVNDLLPVINEPDRVSKVASTTIKDVDIVNVLDHKLSETPKPISTEKLGQNLEEGQISEQDLTTIVDIVRCSGRMENYAGTTMSELVQRLRRIKEQSNIDKRGILEGNRGPSVFGSSMGIVVNTPFSQIGNLRWGDVVEEGIETNHFDGVKDSLPLTRIRGISQGISLEGSVPVSEIVEGMDLSQGKTPSCPDVPGLQDVEVRLVDEVDRGQSSRGDRGGRGHGAYRGGRGRGAGGLKVDMRLFLWGR